jgi:hypothetical protein
MLLDRSGEAQLVVTLSALWVLLSPRRGDWQISTLFVEPRLDCLDLLSPSRKEEEDMSSRFRLLPGMDDDLAMDRPGDPYQLMTLHVVDPPPP